MNKVVNLLQQYISNNQLEKALLECKKTLLSNPNNIVLQKILSHIHNLQQNYEEAIEVSQKLLLELPNDFDCTNNIGYYYCQLEEYQLAIDYINKAKLINPNHPSPYQNQSDIYVKIRDFDKASLELDRCIALHEKNSQNYFNYISTLFLKIEVFIAQKKQKDAVEFMKKYLTIKFDAELLLHLIQISKKDVSKEMIDQCHKEILEKKFTSKLEKFQKLVPSYFALASFYEKDNQELAEEFYVKANKEVSDIQRLTMIKFQKSIFDTINFYEKIKNINITNQKKGERNIFIFGMPRSGTTLTESIVTANDEVFGAGELMSFYDLAYKYMLKGNLSSTEMEIVGDIYLHRTDFFCQNGNKVVDKLPNNFMFLGFIRKFLPAAKIILLLRDPWDTAISLFKQRYVANISYSSSFFNIGIQMSNFEASILFWKKIGVLDSGVMVLKYENLVKETEKYQKEIYNLCSITSPYKPEIREKFFAKTASINQVQKEIHTSSVKKQDFESLKSEFLEAFFSQRAYWQAKGIVDANASDFFGYSLN